MFDNYPDGMTMSDYRLCEGYGREEERECQECENCTFNKIMKTYHCDYYDEDVAEDKDASECEYFIQK